MNQNCHDPLDRTHWGYNLQHNCEMNKLYRALAPNSFICVEIMYAHILFEIWMDHGKWTNACRVAVTRASIGDSLQGVPSPTACRSRSEESRGPRQPAERKIRSRKYISIQTWNRSGYLFHKTLARVNKLCIARPKNFKALPIQW